MSAFVSDAAWAVERLQDSTQPARNAVQHLPKSEKAHVARVPPNCNQHIRNQFRWIRSRMPQSATRESFVQSNNQKDCLRVENRPLDFLAQRTATYSVTLSKFLNNESRQAF